CRQAGPDERVATELRWSDIGVYQGLPGSGPAMGFEHRENCCSLKERLPVTAVEQGIAGPARTAVAWLPVAKHCPRRADEAVIVQCLHHRDSLGPAGVISGGADQQIKVVEVSYI